MRRVHGEATECVVFMGGLGRNRVMLIGRGVAYRKTDETDLLRSKRGVLFIGRGVAYRKTGLHGILFISTVDLLQP